MEPILCVIQREGDMYVAIGHGRALAVSIGFTPVDQARIDIVLLELARNLIMYARDGQLRLSRVDDEYYGPGIVIESVDKGPGIVDVEQALQDGFSTAATLGAGLPGVRRMVDVFQIESQPGSGTYIRTLRWLRRPSGGDRSCSFVGEP